MNWPSIRRVTLGLALAAGVARGAEPLLSGTNGPPAGAALPLWEAGVFGMVGRLPHYRGADEYTVYVLPLPYVIYRGEILQADRDGVRGLFYRGYRFETDLSMNGNPPVDDGNEARRGMRELEPLVEVGPALKAHLYRGERDAECYFEVSARGVISVDRDDLGSRYEGKRASTALVLNRGTLRRLSPWSAGLRAGVDFGDAAYHHYFYDVPEADVLPDRGYYRSEGGYGGCSLSGFLLRDLTPDLSVSLYGRWDNVDGAVYEDSPLVRTRNNTVVGAAVIWRMAVSRRMARTR